MARIEGMWVRVKGPAELYPWLGQVVQAMPSPTGNVFYLLVAKEPNAAGEMELECVSSAGVVIADTPGRSRGPKSVDEPTAKK